MSVIEAIRAARLVAILRRAADVDAQVARLAAAGVRVVEITLDSDDALGAIERARARGDVSVLAGTVRSPPRSTLRSRPVRRRSSHRRSRPPSSSARPRSTRRPSRAR